MSQLQHASGKQHHESADAAPSGGFGFDQRHFTERLVESSVDGILAFDRDCRYTLWNAGMERLTGMSRGLVLGRVAFDVFPFLKETGEDRFFEQALEGQNVVAKDRSYRVPDTGREGYFEGHYSPLRSESGEIIGGLAVIRDVTERKQFEMKMQHAQKLETLGVMAGGIAHDFNNLLMAVLGNAELAMAQAPPGSLPLECLENIQRAAYRAADLCRQMLAYSGKVKFVVRPLDLSKLVDEMVHLLEVAVAKKGVLSCQLAQDLPAIEADAAQIQQVVMNLITNAAESLTGTQGEIVVRTGHVVADRAYLDRLHCEESLPEGLYVYLEVADTGCGMDEETQARLFDPFFTTKFKGRGLGMAAVLGIIRGHHAAIQVDSQRGRGTTVRVLFPPSVQPARQHAKERNSLGEWRGHGTVLVVDDEEMVLWVAQSILQNAGLDVLTARDGQEAVDVYRSRAGKIDLVLIDMTMPHLNGEEAFRRILEIDGNARVIMASGYSEHEATSHVTAKSLAGFIQKPYRASELIAKVRALLER